jgi:hypothetical protein
VLFRDIRSFIRLNFGTVKISFVPCICNKLAHELAAYGACHESVRENWVDDVSSVVRCVATSDFAGSR